MIRLDDLLRYESKAQALGAAFKQHFLDEYGTTFEAAVVDLAAAYACELAAADPRLDEVTRARFRRRARALKSES